MCGIIKCPFVWFVSISLYHYISPSPLLSMVTPPPSLLVQLFRATRLINSIHAIRVSIVPLTRRTFLVNGIMLILLSSTRPLHSKVFSVLLEPSSESCITHILSVYTRLSLMVCQICLSIHSVHANTVLIFVRPFTLPRDVTFSDPPVSDLSSLALRGP